MSTKPQIELFLENESGTQQVAYPFVESDHVSLSNGMDIDTMIRQDVSMPTVTHEDLSFKVGVGDQDVSSAIVDSSVAEMTIKGKTYQNILPEPSTHVLTNNKEMFKVNEGLDPNVEIVDGVSKSAILSGNTLVNVESIKSSSDFNNLSANAIISNDGWITISADGQYNNAFVKMNSMIKPSTKYLIILEIKTNTLNEKFAPFTKWIYSDGTKQTCFSTVGLSAIEGGTTGIFKSVVTTYDDITECTVLDRSYVNIGATSGSITYRTMLIEYQDGMENWSIPYFTGMSSVKMPVLRTVGKNLCDIKGIQKYGGTGNLNVDENGVITIIGSGATTESSVYTNKTVHLKKGKQYTFSCATDGVFGMVNGTDTVEVFLMKKDGTQVIQQIHTNPRTFTCTSTGDYTLRFDVNLGTETHTFSNIQIEEGSVATSYEPYKTNILSTQINLTSDMFEQGGVTTSTIGASYSAVKTSRTDRIRVKELIPIKPNTSYYFKAPDGFGGWCNFYDANGLLLNTTSLNSDSARITSSTTYYAGIVLNKADSSLDVTPSEISGKTVCLGEEVVLRSLPNGVKDTLNLNTGEYVQRIGEVVLDGSEAWNKDTTTGGTKDNTSIFHTEANFNGFKPSPNVEYRDTMMLCDKIPVKGRVYNLDEEGLMINGDGRIYIRINLSRLETNNAGGFKSFLAKENIKIQCELATPIIKTVDLSSSGNWEKVVLNGSENWGIYQRNSAINFTNTSSFQVDISNANFSGDSLALFTDSGLKPNSFYSVDREGVFIKVNKVRFAINKNKLTVDSVDGFKQYLQQNPITLWYQTTAHQDSTQVKQPIFFKEGHIIQTSETDNSLIPTLDYQAKTSNSYVMDLMKANTRYTMKAKSASGTFTIDGTSYGAGTNGTFTTPSSMTNKFLIMSNKTNEEVMIIEGNVVSKTIPYFKGIKSAFEDESKIEVLSTGKNLYPHGDSAFTPERDGWYFINGDRETLFGDKVHKDCGQGAWFYLEGGRYYFNVVGNDNVKTLQVVGEKERLYGSGATIPKGWYALRMRVQNANQEVSITNVMVEKDTETNYEPYKSNSTKIPLLSSLRSLPTGVCDEVIINRETKKATLIQRVGYVMLNGSEEWNLYPTMEQDKTLLFQTKKPTVDGKNAYCVSDKYFHSPSLWSSYYNEGIQLGGGNPISRVDLRVYKGKVSSNNATILREYLSKDPIVVLYELATPIITEVDLEGFPYIYKDGHIFLNGEITPVTEIKYSINQQHQIEASNQDIMRHQKEIDYLYKLIGEYVRVDYKNTLLSLNLELK